MVRAKTRCGTVLALTLVLSLSLLAIVCCFHFDGASSLMGKMYSAGPGICGGRLDWTGLDWTGLGGAACGY